LFSTLAGVTGASACAWGAFVAYQNEAKIALLGLTPSDIAEHGTVSAAMTRLLAERARGRSRCDWAVAVTCSAGPTAAAGSEVGDGFVHVCGPERNHQSRAFHEVGDREQVRHRAVSIAIECVCRTIGLTTD
jgi:PncC family amidohydrolase